MYPMEARLVRLETVEPPPPDVAGELLDTALPPQPAIVVATTVAAST